jgi:hypothetical protein
MKGWEARVTDQFLQLGSLIFVIVKLVKCRWAVFINPQHFCSATLRLYADWDHAHQHRSHKSKAGTFPLSLFPLNIHHGHPKSLGQLQLAMIIQKKPQKKNSHTSTWLNIEWSENIP